MEFFFDPSIHHHFRRQRSENRNSMQLHYMTSQSEDLWGWKTQRTQLSAADFRPWLRIPVLQQTSNSSTKSWSYDAARLDDLRIWKLVILPRSCLIFLAKGSKERSGETVSKTKKIYKFMILHQLVFAKFPINKRGIFVLRELTTQVKSFHSDIICYQTNRNR